jgi:hypothetical protein
LQKSTFVLGKNSYIVKTYEAAISWRPRPLAVRPVEAKFAGCAGALPTDLPGQSL